MTNVSLDQLSLLPAPRRVMPASGWAGPDVVERRDPRLPAQGYRLRLEPSGVTAESADDAGGRHARATLDQLRRLCPDLLPCGEIEDHPAFPRRGYMLDISRNRVPTQERLFDLVDLLAALKFNHLELYTEHTFAYRHHREVWENASPLTAEEIRALDAHARAHGVELVPNQNSFGHLHRWLKLPRYRDLAECPDGHTAWGQWRPYPFSLNPLDPRSLALLAELYEELLPNFSSPRFNVGCDETVDLGQGRSRAACEARGKGRVYLDFLLEVHRLVQRHGRTMHIWGDIILHHPELIPELPRDAVALVWGYEANHPFAQQCEAFRAAGLPFMVCPGTSSWNSLGGRWDNARGNQLGAATHGLAAGATGYLLTDWGDNGHWQPPCISLLPLADAADLAWRGEARPERDLLQAAHHHVLNPRSEGVAPLLAELGRAHDLLACPLENAGALFRLLHQEDLAPLRDRIATPLLLEASMRLADLQTRIENLPPGLLRDEMCLSTAMLRLGAVRGLADRGIKTSPQPTDLNTLPDNFRRLWLATSRPGGLEDSIRPLLHRFTQAFGTNPA